MIGRDLNEVTEHVAQTPPIGPKKATPKIATILCLVGILAGGVAGEILRESWTAASEQHAAFTLLLNSTEVKRALAARTPEQSRATNQIVDVDGPWAKDLCWENNHVVYFVLGDGSFLFDSTRPPTWAYPLVLLLPVAGFLIPWAAMKFLS